MFWEGGDRIQQNLPYFIEIETSTYCNRRCTWCPNALYDRGHKKERILDNVWNGLLDELGSLGYSGWIGFHNYNEPLLDPDIFFRIDDVHHFVPDSKTALFTNGDYLYTSTIQCLVESKITEVRVTLYPRLSTAHESPTRESIYRYLDERDINQSICKELVTRRGLEIHFDIQKTHFFVISPKVYEFTNRGGLLNNNVNLIKRIDPCFLSSYSAAIDYQGNMKFCCQIYDVNMNKNYCIGNILDLGFRKLWFSESMNESRYRLAVADFSGLPACQVCNHKLPIEQLRPAQENFKQILAGTYNYDKLPHNPSDRPPLLR